MAALDKMWVVLKIYAADGENGLYPIRTRTTPLSSCKAKRSSMGRTTRHYDRQERRRTVTTRAASRVGKTIVGGIDLNKARMRRVTEALLALSSSPNGFTASEVAARVRALTSKTHYSTVPATLLMISR